MLLARFHPNLQPPSPVFPCLGGKWRLRGGRRPFDVQEQEGSTQPGLDKPVRLLSSCVMLCKLDGLLNGMGLEQRLRAWHSLQPAVDLSPWLASSYIYCQDHSVQLSGVTNVKQRRHNLIQILLREAQRCPASVAQSFTSKPLNFKPFLSPHFFPDGQARTG